VIFPDQPASELLGIKGFIYTIPCIAMLLGALLLIRFLLKGARLEKMQFDLLDLHASKKATYDNKIHKLSPKIKHPRKWSTWGCFRYYSNPGSINSSRAVSF
jgi:hypothetical protein